MNLIKNNLFLLVVLALFSFSSCANSNDSNVKDDNASEYIPYHRNFDDSKQIGEFLEIEKITCESYLYDPQNLFNCSGMSGNISYEHVHSCDDPRNTMFLTKSKSIVIKLNEISQLGHLYLWNYNNSKYINSSVKKLSIDYSIDANNFTNFSNKSFDLSTNKGNMDVKHNLIDNQEYLDLQGITAQYLRINFLENDGGIYNGLSEIRLYKYQSEIKNGNELATSIYKESGKYTSNDLNNMINNIALNKMNSLDALSSNDKNIMYKSSRDDIIFYFNGNYPLAKIGIWNYNDPEDLNSGVKKIEIQYSNNGKRFTSLGTFSLNKASGKNQETVSNIIELNNVQSQFIRLKYLENYGGNGFGLTALKFILGHGFVSEESIHYTGLFSNYNGWTGADGIFGVNLKGDQSISDKKDTFFNFSDTYIGSVDPINKHRKNYIFKNNSFAYYSNDNINFITDNKVIDVEKMESRSRSDAFAWLGDGFVVNNKYYISRLYIAKEGILGFTQKGEDLVSFDIVDGKIDFNSRKDIIDVNTNKLSYFKDGYNIIFGSAFFENTISSNALNPDGYIYNFGYKDEDGKRMLVCLRFKEEDVENFDKYEYLSASGWTNSITDVVGLIDHVSCEMSVTEINDINSPYYGKFMLTFQKDTIGNEVCISIFNSLTGKFNEPITIYGAKETLLKNGLSQYNAKMHPTLSSKNRYVISYNLNESGSNLNAIDGDIYHPRFIELFEI